MSEQSVFLITGASKGLGRSICGILANKGYVVVGLARQSPELDELDAYLKKYNAKSCAIALDVGSNPIS